MTFTGKKNTAEPNTRNGHAESGNEKLSLLGQKKVLLLLWMRLDGNGRNGRPQSSQWTHNEGTRPSINWVVPGEVDLHIGPVYLFGGHCWKSRKKYYLDCFF